MREAYARLAGDRFPALQEKTREEFPEPRDLRRAVCKIDYWAALYIAPGASDAVERALVANDGAYNKTDVMQYIWNEARYSAIIDSDVSAMLQQLSRAAIPLYAASINWTSLISSPDEVTFSTFAQPWILASDNLQPTTQGARLVYNTMVVILLMIQEFFYLGTLNQLYENFKIYTKLSPHRIIFFRFLISFSYCIIGSLCTTSAIWAFKTGWNVDGSQFVLTWLALLLFAHLNFLTLDVFTVWLPPPFVPMALVSWLVLNVVSILLPFELMSDFYLWSYVSAPLALAFVTPSSREPQLTRYARTGNASTQPLQHTHRHLVPRLQPRAALLPPHPLRLRSLLLHPRQPGHPPSLPLRHYPRRSRDACCD